jgi:hypothetical protein
MIDKKIKKISQIRFSKEVSIPMPEGLDSNQQDEGYYPSQDPEQELVVQVQVLL